MRVSIVVELVGAIVRVFGGILLLPAVVALGYAERHDAVGFVVAAGTAAALGSAMRRASSLRAEDLRQVEGLAVVAGTWLIVAHVGAIPYVWVGFGPIDALFESMSGLTTTGATVVEDFSALGHGVYFWRSLSQWLGGMGVIALFVAILPRLAIGGRQLFFAEAPGPTDEKLTPQLRKTALALWRIYAGLTVLEFLLLIGAGMTIFDAGCHALTTLSAGGFSPHPQSIMGYQSETIEWIVIAFMFLAGANFALQYRLFRGQPLALMRDDEFRAYGAIVILAALGIGLFLWDAAGDAATALRLGLFQALSIITTTGYASDDFALWNDQAKVVIVVLMFIGGSAGSAAGGPKIVRHILIARYTFQELERTLHPRAVLPVKLGGRVVSNDIMRSVLVFALFYMLVFAICTTVVILLGADMVSGFTAAIACLGNIGPGLGLVGPMSSYADLHPLSKIVLTLAMWVGRLEVLTVLALLRPEVIARARWRDRERLRDARSGLERVTPRTPGRR